MNFVLKLLIALDYFLNAFAPDSKPGMTISSHAGMARADGRTWGVIVASCLDHIQAQRCLLSMQGDVRRSQAVIDELEPYLKRAST